MKRLSYFIMAVALGIAGLTTSCSSDYDYSVGKEVAADCPTVYFSNSNESEIFVTSDGEKSFALNVKRENTSGAITVPVIVDSKTGSFNIPENVSFADGEAETQLTITYDEFEGGMNFSIHLADDYINPYLEVAGSTYFKGTLAQLNKVADVVYSTGSRFEKVTNSAIYAYTGENKFQWTNFLGSGIDLTFTVDTSNTETGKYDANDLMKLRGDIIPLSNYYKDDYGYYFMKEVGSTDDYVTWTPEGQSEAVSYFYFYGYYSAHYSYIDFDTASDGYGYGYFYSAVVNDSENYENIYFYLYY